MGRVVVLCLLSLLMLISSLPAQQPAARVCVASITGSAGNLSAEQSRDRLVDLLKRQKQPVDAVALESANPEGAASEAQEKGCGFVVYAEITELHTEREHVYGTTTGVGPTAFNYFATVKYKLEKTSVGAVVGSGNAKARDSSAQETAVLQALKPLAGKIASDVRKNAGAAK